MSDLAEGKPRTRTPLGNVRPSSARALLWVVLGEFVWPMSEPVWSSTLLNALADLDIEHNAARKALQRMANSGFITPVRDGRRVQWAITPRGSRILAAGYERTYGWGDRDTAWDGRWLVLSVTVPEAQRKLRHHLQTRLMWAGLGSPQPGQWLTPHSVRGEEIAQIVYDLGLQGQSHTFVGEFGPVGDEQQVVNAAWDLAQLQEDYLKFIDVYSATKPRTDRDCLRARVALMQDWRRFPYLDPDLPKQFLPPSWPGDKAWQVFRKKHHAWAERSKRHWDRLRADH